jgi:hypothetical protein
VGSEYMMHINLFSYILGMYYGKQHSVQLLHPNYTVSEEFFTSTLR